MKKWILKIESISPFVFDEFVEIGRYDTEQEAIDEMCREFDGGMERSFVVKEDGFTGLIYHPHNLLKEPCPRCGKDVRAFQTKRTYDCHGIPFRCVCEDCWREIEEDPGYDGEYYDELDECIEPDW